MSLASLAPVAWKFALAPDNSLHPDLNWNRWAAKKRDGVQIYDVRWRAGVKVLEAH